ncbi:MAG: hypothetical protein K6B28_12180 [Lachnospiraceae bacterium]|nr:hypothetical protein [Lachnospiraceae bacterium]
MKTESVKRISSIVVFVLALITVACYIMNGMRNEYGVLSTDNMIAAMASAESGTIVNRGFWYGYNMPFNISLIMTVLVKLIGTDFSVVKISMLIFLIIFTVLLIFLFKSLKIGNEETLVSTSFVLLLFMSSEITRTALFSHTTYYLVSFMGLCLIYIVLGMPEITEENKITDEKTDGNEDKRKKYYIKPVLLFVITTVCCINGSHIIEGLIIPLVIAMLIKWVISGIFTENSDENDQYKLKESRKFLFTAALIIVGSVFGILIRRKFFGNIYYDGALGRFTDYGSWFFKEKGFFGQWVVLFTGRVNDVTNMMSAEGIFVMLHYLTAIVILILPIFATLYYKRYDNELARLFIINYWSSFLVTYMIFSLGYAQKDEWRLIGLALMAVCTDCVFLSAVMKDNITLRQIAAIPLLILAFSALLNIIITYAFVKTENPENEIISFLDEHSLDYGYASFDTSANVITVLSGDKIRVRPIEIHEDGTYRIERFDNEFSWYDDEPETERYFVILNNDEMNSLSSTLGSNAVESIDIPDGCIWVFDNNIFTEGQPVYN